MPNTPAILLLAAAIDDLVGDPAAIYSRVPHPVALIGRAIAALDRSLNREEDTGPRRRVAGVAACFLVLAASLAAGWLLQAAFRAISWGWVLEAIAMSMFLAQNSLYRHVAEVADGLARGGLAAGRAAVARIVGRDLESLDQGGIARAALESLAENFSDGVTAPLFWGLLFGLPGILAYKAINTADSMIGHLSERYRDFGWASARLDDLLNLLPARAAGLVLVGAALLLPGTSAGTALRAMAQDAARHRSPNAGWPEAAMAGALGLALAGPRRYGGEMIEDHWMNAAGRRDAGTADIRRGLALYVVACLVQAGIVAAIAVL